MTANAGISLAGKKVLVTGGTRGIGRGVVLALARAGADVLTCYRNESEHVGTLERELKAIGGDHHVVRADVGSPEEIDRLIGECRTRLGRLDVVVNNAGVISHVPFADLPVEEWHRVVDTNLTAAYLVTQKALPLFGESASVVNVGSRVATVGIPLRAHYTAAKAGLAGLCRSLAKELGPRGIRVNVVAPGVIATEAELSPEVLARYRQMTAVRRLGRTEEIANTVLFLASDLAGYITGETVNVDGGI
ncbi:SDR family NAD(P)-dependent oxidoreductase [Streptosporangium pseudovulgare]|uniref:Short-chain dehydrogenase n=1 Tax=Streptosporangium pseudovulgare TaxID=35765 RepID=A0ABQ2R8Q4_9ACTN|nr:SDR family oxidoreductase [Streptosporangium pseudovulgare]GGQ19468.1 short-chain dehydrogenase [Streptosporangium pseudovulgare]